MRTRLVRSPLAALALFLAAGAAPLLTADGPGHGRYEDLLRLFREWRAFQKSAVADGVPDYTAAAMERQRKTLPEMQRRLLAIDPSSWPLAQQVDWHLVRGEMNGLDFDHRVLRPWSRNPCFYAVIVPEESDTPAKEGPAFAGALPAFRYAIPLSAADEATVRTALNAVPAILEQAKVNLVEDARDLWLLGIRVQKEQAALLADFGKRLSPHHPDLAADAAKARRAVDGFRAWLEAQAPSKRGPSGVGVENYDWYLRNVHLAPYGWKDEVALLERELGRARAHLALERARNRPLSELQPIASDGEWRRRVDAAVTEYMAFLADKRTMTITPDMDPALRAREGVFVPPASRDFFAEIDLRDPIVMRCHQSHWFDLARMRLRPHASPVRRGPLLYNIWDGRAEGLATAMEEMMTSAGLLDAHPRGRELVLILVANRAARALAGVRMHGGEFTIEQAVRFAHENTPNGWLRADGDLVWSEQQNYLEQPGYGSSYITGKAQIERLLGELSHRLGERFTLRQFMDDFNASGMIPVSLIRWEMTGDGAEVRKLAGR